MNKTIIDLTEFRDWSGHLTGVQRVVYNIATHFSEDVTTVFASFDSATKQLVTDDIERYKSNSDSLLSTPPEIGTATNARITAQRLYFSIPYSIRRHITAEQKRQLKRVARRSLHQVRTLKAAAVRRGATQKAKIVQRDYADIESGDTIVIGGRLWDHPNYIQYLIEKKQTVAYRLVVILYDLIPIYQQHTFGQGLTEPYARYLFEVLSHADVVLPISRSSANDLARFADETGFTVLPRIDVIRLGDDIDMSTNALIPSWIDDKDKPFALCVGTIEARKNHVLLYQAYKLAKERGAILPKLYIVGKPGWLTGDVMHFFQHDSELRDAISIQGNVTDSELNWLYKHALFTLYPSQYEGWGLPIAESLVNGVPCIASHSSSMSEIAPGLVDSISPFDSAQLLEKMLYLQKPLNNHKRRSEIVNLYKPTTWQDTAESIVKAIS